MQSTTAHIMTEVVGGSGRMGSQFMRIATDAVVVPRGVCPGSLSQPQSPIYVCTPASSWSSIYYERTLPHRRSDLVFVGNGLLPKEISLSEVTVVIPHYAILRVGDKPTCTVVQKLNADAAATNAPPPTYLAGKHAAVVESLLRSDGVLNTVILSTTDDYDNNEVTVKAAQKLLWTSCLWLLCHSQKQKQKQTAAKSSPITVRQVHVERAAELEALVQELWPSFCRVIQNAQTKLSSATTGEAEAAASANDNRRKLPTIHETMQYLEQYSNSIPDAIPSVQLAMAELENRNGVFAISDQALHRQLIEQVAGLQALSIFETTNQRGEDDDDTIHGETDGATPTSNTRMIVHVDLRPTIGLAVHGTSILKRCATGENRTRKVLVIGAGILGSSVALNLAKQNNTTGIGSSSTELDITVVDSGNDASDFGPTTRASWAWLNANQKKPAHYQLLNCLGMHSWRCDPLLRDLPTWSGSLVLYEKEFTLCAGDIATAGFYAKPFGPLTRQECLTLEPNAHFSDNHDNDDGEAAAAAVYSFPNEGCVDPCEAVKVMRQAAIDNGVAFVWNRRVSSILYSSSSSGDVVSGIELCDVRQRDSTDGSAHDSYITTTTFAADVVVVAAGMGSANPGLGGLPLLHRPGRIAYFSQSHPHQEIALTRILVDAVGKSHVLQRRDGTIVAGGGQLEVGGSLTVTAPQPLSMTDQHISGSTSPADALLAGARQLAPALLRDATFMYTAEALRPMPQDGLPSVGYIRPGLYSLVAHSGITLAPLLGSLAATEISNNLDLELLAPYRPTRFFV